jgi:hypothetical protein
MAGQLYLLFVTVLLLFALAITLPVIRDIVREGLQRRREWDTERNDDQNANPAGQREVDDSTETRRCPQCGAENRAAFKFCEECAEPL